MTTTSSYSPARQEDLFSLLGSDANTWDDLLEDQDADDILNFYQQWTQKDQSNMGFPEWLEDQLETAF